MSVVVTYWSATPHPVSETMAWAVRYGTAAGQPILQARSSRSFVRCVKR